MLPSVHYNPKHHEYCLDELLVFSDLFITIHIWSKKADSIMTYIDFRLIQHESHDLDGNIFYPSQSLCSPSPDGGTKNAREAGDIIGNGYLKWDGCCELEINTHLCGFIMWRELSKAIDNLYEHAKTHFGFEI